MGLSIDFWKSKKKLRNTTGRNTTWGVFKAYVVFVAVNRGYDAYFRNGLVMGYADCKCSLGLVETSK